MDSIYYKEIGQLLQAARQSLHLTLPQASAALHIRSHYLQALEVGTLSDLPGSIYTRGYLQSYAAFLHLDKDEILRRFEILENDFPEKELFFPKVFGKEKKPSYLVVFGGLALVIIIYLLWFLVASPDSSPPYVMQIQSSATSAYLQNSASANFFNHACTLRRSRVYPPCYWMDIRKVGGHTLQLQNRRVISVLYLK